jgi:hypothetical protein
MPWLDDIAPDAPSIQKTDFYMCFVINYNGKEKIKSFGIFSASVGTKATAKNAQLVKLFVANKSAIVDISTMTQKKNEKFYVASVDLNNNVSSLVELN